MNIEVTNIKGLDNIIKHKKKPVPQSSHPDFPVNLFFTYCSFGMKNSGKSYSICKLLSLFDKYPVKDTDGEIMPNRVIWFSPCTLDSWRYSRRSGKGKRCVTQGLPSHGCILLITLGVGGI